MRGAVECEGCLNKTKLEQIGPRDEVGSGGQGVGLWGPRGSSLQRSKGVESSIDNSVSTWFAEGTQGGIVYFRTST